MKIKGSAIFIALSFSCQEDSVITCNDSTPVRIEYHDKKNNINQIYTISCDLYDKIVEIEGIYSYEYSYQQTAPLDKITELSGGGQVYFFDSNGLLDFVIMPGIVFWNTHYYWENGKQLKSTNTEFQYSIDSTFYSYDDDLLTKIL